MLRKSRVDPNKSSYEVLYGKHDYNTNSFAPLDIEVELHEIPNKGLYGELIHKRDIILGSPRSITYVMESGFQIREKSG